MNVLDQLLCEDSLNYKASSVKFTAHIFLSYSPSIELLLSSALFVDSMKVGHVQCVFGSKNIVSELGTDQVELLCMEPVVGPLLHACIFLFPHNFTARSHNCMEEANQLLEPHHVSDFRNRCFAMY
jgi:hypothetical protein